MKENDAVLGPEKLQDMLGLKGAFGKMVAKLVIKALEIDKVNKVRPKYAGENAPDFARDIIKEVGARYEVSQEQLAHLPAEGAFITVSNHPIGSVDGLILCDLVGHRRPDYKLLTTYLLSLIPELKDSFLPVDNLSGNLVAQNVDSMRAARKFLQNGGGMGFFPAGEVSTYQKGEHRTAMGEKPVIEDIPWSNTIAKLIKRSGAPVIPIYFDAANSNLFHTLGKIHPRLRTIRLVHELFNKRGALVKVRIGQPIQPSEYADMDPHTLSTYIRNRTYALEAQCQEEPVAETQTHLQPLAAPVDPALVREEMERVTNRVVFTSGDYRCYLVSSAEIPNTMKELARLREMVFRAVGEGTGLPQDTDQYDTYYKQLILWSISNQEIAGAYRIGVGSELMARPEGARSFYSDSLFHFQEGLTPYLPKAMELGRTIILPQYQRDVTTLKLLMSGILTSIGRIPGMEYTLGPASISNSIPYFYKSLIVHFMLKNCSAPDAASMVKPGHPFQPDFLRVNPDSLLAPCHSLDDLDRLILALSDGKYRLPVLLRKYVSFGARVVGFNVDPDFSNSLDAFVLQWVHDMPENSFRSMGKMLTPEELDEVRIRTQRV